MGVKIDGDNDLIKINDVQVLKAQETAQADTGAATATNPTAPAALTGAANAAATGAAAALTGVTLTDNSGGTASATIADITEAQNAGSADRVPTEDAIASLAAELEASRVDIAAQKVEVDKVITDLGLVLAQADKTTADLAAARAENVTYEVAISALVVDVEALRTTNNALLAKLRTHGLIAT